MAETYPVWFQEFLDAPTDQLPGYFGDWYDIDAEVSEDGKSITFSAREDQDDAYTKEATFHGEQQDRRKALVLWLNQTIVLWNLVRLLKDHPEDVERLSPSVELPIRLCFNASDAKIVLRKEWS